MEEDGDEEEEEEDVLPELERCETLARAHEETNAGIFFVVKIISKKVTWFSASYAPWLVFPIQNMYEKYARVHIFCDGVLYCVTAILLLLLLLLLLRV